MNASETLEWNRNQEKHLKHSMLYGMSPQRFKELYMSPPSPSDLMAEKCRQAATTVSADYSAIEQRVVDQIAAQQRKDMTVAVMYGSSPTGRHSHLLQMDDLAPYAFNGNYWGDKNRFELKPSPFKLPAGLHYPNVTIRLNENIPTEPPMSQTDRMWAQEANSALTKLGQLIPGKYLNSMNVEEVYNERQQELIAAKADYDAARAECDKREAQRKIDRAAAIVEDAKKHLAEVIAEANAAPASPAASTIARKNKRRSVR